MGGPRASISRRQGFLLDGSLRSLFFGAGRPEPDPRGLRRAPEADVVVNPVAGVASVGDGEAARDHLRVHLNIADADVGQQAPAPFDSLTWFARSGYHSTRRAHAYSVGLP